MRSSKLILSPSQVGKAKQPPVQFILMARESFKTCKFKVKTRGEPPLV
jgi:hypothetical protein